jgi:hypothetical protein
MSDGHAGRATFVRRHLPIVGFVLIWAFLALHIGTVSIIADTAELPAGATTPVFTITNVIMVLSLTLLTEWLRALWVRLGGGPGGVALGVWTFGAFAVYFYGMVDYGHGGPAAAVAAVLCGIYLAMLVRHWDLKGRAAGLLNGGVSE